jgi:NTE family protein
MLKWSRVLPPRALNPLGLDPLAKIVRDQIDFDALRRASPLKLFVAATHARSGALRVFREHELSADALLASACLPQLRDGVTIDGEVYWDGGFAANPPIVPLALDAGAADLLLVLLMPLQHADVPQSAAGIEARVLELGFSTPLLAELRTLARLRDEFAPRWWSRFDRRVRRLAQLRLHAVDAQPSLGHLPAQSRMVAHLPFLQQLRDLGRACARQWSTRHGDAVGRSATFDAARPTS